jgi:two-component system cell cycle response regulator DivK
VILLDMQLPDMSGLDVLETLKSDPRTRSLKVVALSASYGAEDVSRTMEAGALDYRTKPISVDRFVEGLCRLLPVRRHRSKT